MTSGPAISLALAVEAGDWGDAGAIEALAETALAAAARDLSERERPALSRHRARGFARAGR
jgi:probable rRNA maturation factor